MTRWFWFFLTALGFSVADDSSNETKIWEEWVPWSEYSLFPTLPIAAPLSQDKKCREDSRRLILSLKNETLWATQMWDSSATSAFGVLRGNKYQLGNYDECLAVTQPIRSHYCHAIITATVHNEDAFWGDAYELNPDPNATVWRKFQNSHIDSTQYSRDISQWGLCVPSSCNATEMQKAINIYLRRLNERLLKENRTTYEVEVPSDYCYDGSDEPLTYGEVGFWVFTWVILILVGIATSIDLAKKKELVHEECRTKRLFLAFSAKRNWKKLMSSEELSPEVNHLKFLHGVRCMSMALIVLDHHVCIFLIGTMFSPQSIEEFLRSSQNIFLPHGDLLVDTFFFLSGFLGTYTFLVSFIQKRFNVLLGLANRFLRLAPLYFYIIWFTASAILRFGSGPVWKIGLQKEVDYCRKNWWANILFIQNYVNAKEMCMLHAWYLPCDFHFFILILLLMVLMQKNKKIGAYSLHIITLVAIIIPGIITYQLELLPLLSFKPKLIQDPRSDPSFEYLYLKSHARAAVYLMGTLTAYHLYERRNSTWKMAKIISVLTCLLGLGLLFAPMLYGSLYFNPRKAYNLTESVIFSILRRFSWGLGWVLFMIVNRFGEIPIFGKVFSWKISVPLSKVTYSVYLIHFSLQMGDEFRARVPSQFFSFEMFYKGTNDLFFATGFAIALYLIIELPFRNLFKELIFSKPKKKEPEENHLTANKTQVFSVKL